MRVNWNFPEAELNNTFELYNSRILNSQERKIYLKSMIRVYGAPNVTVSLILVL